MKKILVNKPIHTDAIDRLMQEFDVVKGFDATPDEIFELLPDINGVILCAGMKMFAEEMAIAKNLQVIGRHGAGLDIVDLEEATRRNIPVVYTPYGPTESTAEHAFMLMMATARQVTYLDRQTRQGNFNIRDRVVGFEFFDSNIGVVGFGNIGRRFAEMCRDALQMNVFVFDPYVENKVIEEWGAEPCENLLELMGLADIVSLHIPSTQDTRCLIDAEALQALGPDGYLVNTSRGAVVDEAALISALQKGEIAGAGLDVFEPEPPAKDNPLFNLDNVVLTPHLASFTSQGRRRMGLMVVEDVIKVLNGQTPKYLANVAINQK